MKTTATHTVFFFKTCDESLSFFVSIYTFRIYINPKHIFEKTVCEDMDDFVVFARLLFIETDFTENIFVLWSGRLRIVFEVFLV